MTLEFSDVDYTIYQFSSNKDLPPEVLSNAFSWTRTADEISLVSATKLRLDADRESTGWQCFRVSGQLDFDTIGVLSRLSQLLADANISIFVISTYNTDYFFLKSSQIELAKTCLATAGFTIAHF